jgi:tRNA(fMet)-specific endonuclease VapC
MSYLIDTDWVIDHFEEHKPTTDKVKELKPEGIALSIISLSELYEGVIYSEDPEKTQYTLDMFLSEFPVLPVDEEICRMFGMHRGRLRMRGKLIGDFDLLIGATCLRWGLTLLGNNRRHYERIEGLRIVSIR